MDDRSSGMSWIAVLFVIIVIFAIFGNGFGGWGRGNMPAVVSDGGCSRVSNCQVEKQEIIDTAHTQYLIEQQSNDTRMEINASTDETLRCVLVRSDNEAVVVNLDIEPAEQVEEVLWVDPIHKAPGT